MTTSTFLSWTYMYKNVILIRLRRMGQLNQNLSRGTVMFVLLPLFEYKYPYFVFTIKIELNLANAHSVPNIHVQY